MRRVVLVMVAVTMAGCRPADRASQAADTTASHGLSRRDEMLLAAANVALPPPGVTAADLPEPQSSGAQLTAQYCAQCHELPSPAMHSATDWPGIARRMWLRSEGLSPSLGVKVPTLGERFTVLEYLIANSLKVSGANLPSGRGRDAFSEVCSQCHALPDPRVHSREDWPAVYARMERNMERMKVAPPTRTQTSDILLYLQTVASRP